MNGKWMANQSGWWRTCAAAEMKSGWNRLGHQTDSISLSFFLSLFLSLFLSFSVSSCSSSSSTFFFFFCFFCFFCYHFYSDSSSSSSSSSSSASSASTPILLLRPVNLSQVSPVRFHSPSVSMALPIPPIPTRNDSVASWIHFPLANDSYSDSIEVKP